MQPRISGAAASAIPFPLTGPAKDLVCLLSGAALPLAFAPWNFPWLAIVSPGVLFYCWLDARPVVAFRRGLLFGLGMFGVGVSWLHISLYEFGGMSLVAAVGTTLVVVAYLALFPAAVGFLGRHLDRAGRAAQCLGVVPALWTLGEWVRNWLLSGFPWLHLGYSQTDTPLAGVAAVGGVFAVSWVVAIMAGTAVLVCTGARRERLYAVAAAALVATTAWAGAGHDWTRHTGVVLKATLVQGAIPQQLKWRDEERLHSLDVYRELTQSHWDSDIIVWPETAIPAFKHQIQNYLDELAARAVQNGVDLYVGLPYLDESRAEYFNSVFLVNRPGHMYNKRHLVPFGEYFPLKPLLRNLLASLDIPMSDFTPGESSKPVLVGINATAGISICYEDTFGEEVIQSLPEAQILINVSNDGWFGDSAAPHQHLQMARMRSLETGRYLLRATNTGISAVIDAGGAVLARSPQFAPSALSATVELTDGLTPYARFGNLPVVAAAFLLAALIPCAGRRKAGQTKT